MRTIFSYTLRGGRMTPAQSSALARLAPRWCVPFAEKMLDLDALFPGPGPRIMEIGFGMGETTAGLAEANPGIGFLGVEVHTPGVGKLLWEIEKRGIVNIKIINHDAVAVLEYMLAPASLNGVHIFFPDPWPKKRHNKRRLIQPDLTALLSRVISPGGFLRVITDWASYAEHIRSVAAMDTQLHPAAGAELIGLPARGTTAFERKGLKAGRFIHDLVFIRNPLQPLPECINM